MVTESYLKMMSDVSTRSMLNNPDFEEDFGHLIQEQRREPQEASEIEKELNVYRSGSAPPTVEGSLNAVGGLFDASVQLGLKNNGGKAFETEDELRADPAYVNYYYSNVNLNPRLPPPLLSKEDWRFAQRLQGGRSVGGIGDRRRASNNDSSLFSVQPGYSGEEEGGADWSGDGLIGLPGLGLGSRQKSIAEMIQDDMAQSTSVSRHPPRPASCNAFDGSTKTIEGQFSQLSNELASNPSKAGISMLQNAASSASYTYASAVGASMSRSTTPDPQHVARVPSPRIPPVGVGRGGTVDKRSIGGLNSVNGILSNLNEPTDLVAPLSNLNLANNGMGDEENISSSQIQHNIDDRQNLFCLQGDQNPMKKHPYLSKSDSGHFHSLSGYANSPASPSMTGQLGSGNLPPLYQSAAVASVFGAAGMDTRTMGQGLGLGPNMMASAAELQNLRAGNHALANGLQMPLLDPLYLQYLRSNEYAAAQIAALNDPAMNRDSISSSYMDLLELQKAYLGALLSPQKSQYLGKSGSLNHGYYGNPPIGVGMSYPGSPLGGPLLPNSPVGLGNPVRHGERNMRFSSMRNLAGSVLGAWHSNAGGKFDEGFGSSLLDEFKSNKTKCFELQEIAGHVVEFSADQYGSRFIQQKLETASGEEKDMVFNEIMPQALSLMTDVFGNYVIQKFFEHGSASQIRELAEQLTGHVLTLSLQMYGCRVIQKAIEVVDLDQQTKMVKELDGHVMRCVRDQNGNHVIQKCIECIPEDAIQFIVSTFYDQVVMLSTHPYGCRVIQRILEHCRDLKTQRIMMDEIMQSVCMLAQDQYGNYVVQHVLEHGKSHERSAIIKKLTGQIVQMSQQKFASNVIEKCLAFGTPSERENLINEMLGSTDEYEPLQVMMKDQFANYVVQKVLETCDDQQLELILNRIKVHLNALKKYTFGKHIVARVEKLVAAGERRISIQTGNSA